MRQKFLLWISRQSVQHTWRSLSVLLLITAVLGYLASGLEFSAGVSGLLPDSNPRAKEYNLIVKEFNNASNIIVLASGERDNLVQFADSLKPALLTLERYVEFVENKFDLEFFRKNAFKLFNKTENENFEELFTNVNLWEFLENLNNSFEKEFIGDDGLSTRQKELNAVRFLDGIEEFLIEQRTAFDGRADSSSGIRAMDAISLGNPYYFSPDKDKILVMVEPTFNMLDDMNLIVDAVNAIESKTKSIAEHFNVKAGLTGSLVLGRDEMHAMQNDSMLITLLALLGILILFIIAFRMIVSPVLAVLTVFLGIIWALGISSLFVSSLNLMTSMMAVILAGLGVDFSVHVIAGYSEGRSSGKPVQSAMDFMVTRFGPGIITGGVTTGLAFLTLMISNNDGMDELGLVIGIGIIVTMLANLFFMPTFLAIREIVTGKFSKLHSAKAIEFHKLGSIAFWVSSYRLPTGIIVLIITGIFIWRASHIETDYNYLNMEPVGLESIKLQEEMIDAFDISSDYIMFTADNLDSSRALTEAAKKMRTGGRIESLSDYLPGTDSLTTISRVIFLHNIRSSMKHAKVAENPNSKDVEFYFSELERLGDNIIEMQDAAFLSGQDRVVEKCTGLVGSEIGDFKYSIIGRMLNYQDSNNILDELGNFNSQFANYFKESIPAMANDDPVSIDSLSTDIRSKFIGKSGDIFLSFVLPKQNIWENIQFLESFVNEASAIHPNATGLPPIFYELMTTMAKDGKIASIFAIFVVLIVLIFDLRSFKLAALAMIPLIIGSIWTLGIMEAFGLKLTMLNMMIVPLIIGIGIDDGVHIVHRYRHSEHISKVFASAGRAIFLTSLTTMLGFGSLWFATYRGLGSMGIALFIGVGTCFLATIFVLPIFLKQHFEGKK